MQNAVVKTEHIPKNGLLLLLCLLFIFYPHKQKQQTKKMTHLFSFRYISFIPLKENFLKTV